MHTWLLVTLLIAATPEALEQLSRSGRNALAAGQLDQAAAFAQRTQSLAEAELKHRPLDQEPHLPIALGAAIEVQAQVLAKKGDLAAALEYLRVELALYRATSIRARIQKNINLLSLEGRVAPPLEFSEFLGPKPPTLASLKGKPVLLFFWAHWCGDCRGEAPLLAQIRSEYANRGLVVIGPTQRYGYGGDGEDIAPAAELKYIDSIRRQFYSQLLDVPVPLNQENFRNYGASTTPTLVLIDRQGIVRLYHPGAMKHDELIAALRRIL